jgi:hypothetical protein
MWVQWRVQISQLLCASKPKRVTKSLEELYAQTKNAPQGIKALRGIVFVVKYS